MTVVRLAHRILQTIANCDLLNVTIGTLSKFRNASARGVPPPRQQREGRAEGGWAERAESANALKRGDNSED